MTLEDWLTQGTEEQEYALFDCNGRPAYLPAFQLARKEGDSVQIVKGWTALHETLDRLHTRADGERLWKVNVE